ncbi:long-chain fatty acid--CoA ligase [Boudabousia liubingyangii]|uniref:Long-chain fatty acid--CoA ligase n=1 Tax=Boudabousia liubingyangii TaxID=1921764 RepID=A0A1Q5PN78_9ACTO|nr:AMP-binding protein [Boudabousia liubingyangii]OKL49011.1 long-chain fatty acid--CoA ligase [Boudabousia liubingyangii]
MGNIWETAWEHYDRGVPHEIPVPDQSLYFLLKSTAEAYPNQTAIDYFGATWTYSQILAAAEKGANLLAAAGVKRGDTVALALPNCPQHFIVFYALMRLGATAAEHNPLAPKSQIEQQLGRHGGKVAVVWEQCAENFESIAESGGEVFTVDISAMMPVHMRAALKLPLKSARKVKSKMRGPRPDWAKSWDQAIRRQRRIAEDVPHAEARDIAVILHTGGTNGIPKSVPLTHQNIWANSNQNTFWVYKLKPAAETFWSLLPYFHAFGMTFFMVASVSLGACQIVLPTFDVDLALKAHKRRPVSFFVGVPPMFDRIAKAARKQKVDISTIKYAISGGMPLSRSIAETWEDTTGHFIIEGYGLSETSPTICGSPLTPERRHGALGLPFPSTHVKLVDPNNPDVEVPDGEPGEILVQGPQVFSGYLDDEEATKNAFHDGWFRTGDIARNEDGFLVMADRLKELVITSGFNVYPSEVEKVLEKHPQVKSVAIVGTPDDIVGEVVTAAVVPENESQMPTLESLRELASQTLPRYALPKAIHRLEELPRSVMGKVLRHEVRRQILGQDSPE